MRERRGTAARFAWFTIFAIVFISFRFVPASAATPPVGVQATKDASGWVPPLRIQASAAKPEAVLVEWDPETGIARYAPASAPPEEGDDPVFLGYVFGRTDISEEGRPFETILKGEGWNGITPPDEPWPAGRMAALGITELRYDGLDPDGRAYWAGSRAYLHIPSSSTPHQLWQTVPCPESIGICQNLWGALYPVTELWGNMRPPAPIDRSVRVNGQAVELPQNYAIRHNLASNETRFRHYLPLTRGTKSWWASLGVEVLFGEDLIGNFRSNYIFLRTNGRVVSVLNRGTPSFPSDFALLDLGVVPERISHFSEGTINYVEIESLFEALGASEVRVNGGDGIWDVKGLHPGEQTTGWTASCLNHNVFDPAGCRSNRFAFNMLLPYWENVAREMGIFDPEMRNPGAYYSLLTTIHRMDPEHVGSAQWAMALSGVNHHAIYYEAANYSLVWALYKESVPAVMIALGVWEGVNLVNSWTTTYYPEPANMHRSVQLLEEEMKRVRLLGAEFTEAIQKAVRGSSKIPSDIPIIVAPYKNADLLPDGPVIVVRYAKANTPGRGGLANQARSNGTTFSEVPGFPDWVFNVEQFVNGVAVDAIATSPLFPNQVFLADTKVGYSFMFRNKDYKQGPDPRWESVLNGKVKDLQRLIDGAEYMRRVTGNGNHKVAIYHPNPDFVDWMKAESIKEYGQATVDEYVQFISSNGHVQKVFDPVQFPAPPVKPGPLEPIISPQVK